MEMPPAPRAPSEQQAARPAPPVDARPDSGAPSNAPPGSGSAPPPAGAHADDGPPVPDDIREAARSAPDHWLGMVDPGWTDEAPPPNWAVIGEWRSGPTGQIEEWRPNDEYRPSPRMRGWPEPSDPVDAAAQLAVTGYGPAEDAVRALSAAEVTVLRAPGGGPLLAAGGDGAPVVPVFTATRHQPFLHALAHDTLAAGELARTLAADGAALSVNPAGPAHLLVGADEVVDALDRAPSEDDSGTTTDDASPHPHLPTSTGRKP